MSLHLQPIRVATGHDEEGQLVFTDDDRLVAVLTRLSGLHEDLSGHWFLEAGFMGPHGSGQPTFASLDAAQDWISQQMAGQQARSSALRSS